MTNRNYALKLYTFLFLTCFTLFWGLYQWLGLPLFSYMAADFALFLVASVFSVVIVTRNNGRFVLTGGSRIFAGLFLLTCIEILNTCVVAPTQPLYLSLSEAFPYISVCLEAFVLSRLIRSKKDLCWFMNAIEISSVTIACFSILQFILYPDVIIFPTDSLPLRNGLHRIYVGGGSVLSIGALISAGNLLSSRERKSGSLLNVILVLITMTLVRQARSNTAYLLIVLVLGVLSVSNIPKPVRFILCLTATGLVIIGFILVDGVDALAVFVEEDSGFGARLKGIEFFIDKFKDYPLLGMGFITTSGNLDPVSYGLLCSSSGYRFDRSDVGIFGLLNMFGVVGVVWYIAYLRRIGSNAKKIRKASGMIHGKLIAWYLILTSLNLIVTTMQMSMMIALTVVLTDKMLEFSNLNLKGCRNEGNQNSLIRCESPISQ